MFVKSRLLVYAFCLLCLVFVTHCQLVVPVDRFDVNKRFAEKPPQLLQGPKLKDPNRFSFVYFSDFQVDARLKETLRTPAMPVFKAYLKKNPVDFLVSGGDNTENGSDAEYNYVNAQFKTLGVPIYWCLGNHDLFGDGWKNWKTHYGTTVRKVTVGNTSIYILDNASGTVGRVQREWLEKQLKSDRSVHRFVVLHFAMYTGNHYELDGQPHFRETYTLSSLFEKYKVKHVLTGHSHIYREVKINAVEYTTLSALKENSPHKAILRIEVNGAQIKKTLVPFTIPGYTQ